VRPIARAAQPGEHVAEQDEQRVADQAHFGGEAVDAGDLHEDLEQGDAGDRVQERGKQ
jgi:hypothetical protein